MAGYADRDERDVLVERAFFRSRAIPEPERRWTAADGQDIGRNPSSSGGDERLPEGSGQAVGYGDEDDGQLSHAGSAMDDIQRQRLADNETALREVNERVERRVERWEELEQAQQWVVCECSDPNCMERLAVTLREYQMVRNHPLRFIMAPRHNVPDIERVVVRHDRYWVAEKHAELE